MLQETFIAAFHLFHFTCADGVMHALFDRRLKIKKIRDQLTWHCFVQSGQHWVGLRVVVMSHVSWVI